MHPVLPICLVFLGCCSNVVILELLISEMPGSGNIITFSQFLFIAIEGFIFTAKFGSVAPSIPMKNYVLMVIMFFIVQVVNNQALNFHISMPLHVIFRAGSLIANLILGIIILKRSYKTSKYLSVLMISIGIVLCTIASSSDVKSGAEKKTENKVYEYFIWLIGIAMLLFALFMSARMGIFQETIYSRFGKHPSEALFYNHALPLPGFLLFSADIYRHAVMFSQSAPMFIPILNTAMPKMWIYLIGNVLTQYPFTYKISFFNLITFLPFKLFYI
ncbi:SLC35B4 [Acanthosepion pharaonis]|uniref:SLC35B4 n=1 Tax=Acanthosepion pharaonis TaxID=158019 RepID=A0A812EKI3_ACAPH|nr:SLC35B4 [Sepia pharaonis]